MPKKLKVLLVLSGDKYQMNDRSQREVLMGLNMKVCQISLGHL